MFSSAENSGRRWWVDEQGRVNVRRSEHVARMVRYREKPFFAQLGRRLAWLDERRLKAVSLPDESPPRD